MTIVRSKPQVELLALVKGKERYVLVIRPFGRRDRDVFGAIGRWAANPELSLTWPEAAAMVSRLVGGSPGFWPADAKSAIAAFAGFGGKPQGGQP